MSKLEKMKQAKQAKQAKEQSLQIEKQTVKPGLTIQGLAEVSSLKKEIESLRAYVLETNQAIKAQSEKLEKLYQVSFNNGNDEIVKLLKALLEKMPIAQTKQPIESIKTEKASKGIQESKEVPEKAFSIFQKYFSGNVTEENFNKAMQANFDSFETMENSLKVIEKTNQDNGKGFLCARKSKKAFNQAIWQVNHDLQGKAVKTEKKAASPTIDFKYFSKGLEIEQDTIKDIYNLFEELDLDTEENETDFIDCILEENEEADIDLIEEFKVFIQG
jgi:hypothetical protein